MARSSYHHGDLRRALIDAAVALVLEKGPSSFTMAEAGRLAGVSSGAPYRHFTNREDLLRAVADEGQRELDERIATAMGEVDAEDPAAPLERFRVSGVAYVRFAAECPGHFKVMSMPEFGLREDHPEMALWRELAAHVQRHAPEQALDPRHPLIARLAAQSLVHGLAHMFLMGHLAELGIGAERAEQLADAITLVDLHGLSREE